MTVHFHLPIFWTACNMSARPLNLGTPLQATQNKSAVTCGNCKRSQSFFSLTDKPEAPIITRYRKAS